MNTFVCERIPESVRESFLKGRVILGTEAFKEWVLKNFKGKGIKRGIPLQDQKFQRKAQAKQILEQVGVAFDVSPTELRSSGRFRENPGRKMAIYLLRQLGGLSQEEIARWMMANNTSTIAKTAARYREELNRSRRLRKLTEEIAHQIMSHVKP